MNIPKELFYTKSHEWVAKNADGTWSVGLSDYAQHELGDLVFVNLPEEGDEVSVGDSFADVESVKAVSDVYSPATGVVAAVNELLFDTPEAINSAPYEAWMIKVSDISDEVELLSAEQYEELLSGEGA